ncbi:MFS general substrate transporter [Panus rudis PR-1116 ss-1]|nr:MFS general substrate transporter [Panus rudis PR-1116 ss-1]
MSAEHLQIQEASQTNEKKTVSVTSNSNPNTTPHDADTPKIRSTLTSCLLVLTTSFAMILNTANSTAVAIALPTIGRDLNITEAKLQWLVSAYSLSAGCLLLFLGRVADLYGRKKVFLLGILIQGAFGLGCSFAQDEITIDVLRGLQGVGGAAVVPAGLGILAHAFPPSPARAIAFSTFAAGAPVGAAIGSVIGGILTQLTSQSWRSTFYLLTGISALVFIGGLFSMDKDVIDKTMDRRLDWIGALLVTAGLVFIVFVLSDGSIAENGWATSYIIALLVLGVLLVVAFLAWQYYLEKVHDGPDDASKQSIWTPPPLMKLSIWTRAKGQLAVMLFIGFLEWCSFFAFTFWIQLYYQDYLQLSPIETMLRLLPMAITGVICNVLVALFVGRVSFVIIIVIGTLFTGVADLLFAVINVKATYWAFGFPAAILSVFGADFVMAAGSLFVAKVALLHEQSVAGALLQTMMQLGGAFGLAITTIIFNSTLTHQTAKLTPSGSPLHAQELAYKAAMWGGFAFGAFGAILAALFLRGVGIVGHRGPPKSQTPTLNGDEGLEGRKSKESDVTV